ncbi:Os05g0141350, partial [Oryza sativa Japonica Group]
APQQRLAGGDRRRGDARVAVVAAGEVQLGDAPEVRDHHQARVLAVGELQRRRAGSPEERRERLERRRRAAEARWEAFPDRGDVGGREGEGACHEVAGRRRRRHDVELAVRKRRRRWATRVEELAAPCRPHRRGGEPAGELADGEQELRGADGVAHGVVDADREDEAAAEQPGHLHEQQRRAEHAAAGALDVEQQLVHGRERRPQLTAAVTVLLQLLQPHVGVGLDEQHALAGAVDDKLPLLHLPDAPGEWVVRHQRLAERAPDDARRVVLAAGAVEESELDLDTQRLVVVEVGQPLGLARCRRGGADELGLSPAHGE